MKQATMNDIAIAAGVSRTTVSHALSGAGRVAPETRERVRRIADEMGFTPSARALALKTGRSGVLAIVNAISAELAGDVGEMAYFTTAAAAAAGEALEAGYTLALVPPTAQATWLERLDIEGAVVMDPIENDPLAVVLRRRHLPFVTIGSQLGSDGASSVAGASGTAGAGAAAAASSAAGATSAGDDGRDGTEPRDSFDEPAVEAGYDTATELALDHLWARGARRPALLVTTERRSYGVLAQDAYAAWTRSHGVEPIALSLPETGAEAAAQQAVGELLEGHPDLDAVFTPVDSFAVGALAAAGAAGRQVPDDLRIVTLEGVRARACSPQLTAVDDRPGDAARAAIRALIGLLRGDEQERAAELRDPLLIVRAST